MDLPTAAREGLIRYRKHASRDELAASASSGERSVESRMTISIPRYTTLRDYQLDAVSEWFSHDKRGILEMATGSGKTITALACLCRVCDEESPVLLVIAVPYTHLVQQWIAESRLFGFEPMRAFESRDIWHDRLAQMIADLNHGRRQHAVVVTTHRTLSSEPFLDCIGQLRGKGVLVADEVHHLGAQHASSTLPDTLPYRLGLSATPVRWFDEFGTRSLFAYFGDPIFEYSLSQAIEDGALTRYHYYPHIIELTDDEAERYRQLSMRIARLMSKRSEPDVEAGIEKLLQRRALILNRAQGKLPALEMLLGEEANVHHALVYCAQGQVDEVTRLLAHDVNLTVHRFTQHESAPERARILRAFAEGEVQALAAIRCLDEGVDVPATRSAYILASTGNPREFIQRRGRVLRRYAGKTEARIHDFIAVPPSENKNEERTPVESWERSVITREVRRFNEFASLAENQFQATEALWEMADRYGVVLGGGS